MNGLVRKEKNLRLNCVNESMDRFIFCFVKEQNVERNEEYVWGILEYQVSGKNKFGKCGEEK